MDNATGASHAFDPRNPPRLTHPHSIFLSFSTEHAYDWPAFISEKDTLNRTDA